MRNWRDLEISTVDAMAFGAVLVVASLWLFRTVGPWWPWRGP